MDYSRIGETVNAGKELVDVKTVLEDLLEERRSEFQDAGIAFDIDWKDETVVVASKKQLFSIFENLLLNSKEALTNVRLPSDRPKVIEFRTKVENGHLLVKIKDNGIGIDGKIRDRIYEPFFTNNPATGTGLGLSSAMKYLSLYDGEMSFDTVPGDWTEFTVSMQLEKR